MTHCIVALDEFGRTICEENLDMRGGGRFYSTTDWGYVMKVCGLRAYSLTKFAAWRHPRNRRNVAQVEVAGFEIVSEES